jgi:hypothetical protein
LGPIAVLAWLVFRPSEELTDKQDEDYQNAEDSLFAASHFDMQGDWERAIKLYRLAAERWPEHRTYAENSIEQIRGKQLGTSPKI